MSSTYAGADAYPTSITIPSDGDSLNAASVNSAFEGLADRTAHLTAADATEAAARAAAVTAEATARAAADAAEAAARAAADTAAIATAEAYALAHGARIAVHVFTASDTMTVPARVVAMLAVGHGAGGGGGGGTPGDTTTDSLSAGGAGGGGALARMQLLTGLTPGATLTVTIPVGGVGGAAGTSGGDGGATTVTDGSTTWTWRGASGGRGINAFFPGASFGWQYGGTSVAPPVITAADYWLGDTGHQIGPPVQPQMGGYGTCVDVGPGTGGSSPEGYAGGAGGTGVGTDVGGYYGGGAGGGGGAGPAGAGASGGTGGDPVNFPLGSIHGTGGASASANSGAGGGGGGAGAARSSAPGTGAPGGAGGSGKLTLIWVYDT